jgi:hypothetical protein
MRSLQNAGTISHDTKSNIMGACGRLLSILCMPGITAMLASTVEQCSLLLPLRWGARPIAMLLWLNW